MTIQRLMLAVLDEVTAEDEAVELTARGLGVRTLKVVCQPLSNSGKTVYRVYLPHGESVVLRTSVRPETFRFTRLNIEVLRALGLPVQSVLAEGRTESGGSYILLNWVPGRDLIQGPALHIAQSSETLFQHRASHCLSRRSNHQKRPG